MIWKKTYFGIPASVVGALALIVACSADGQSIAIIGDACDGPCGPSQPIFVSPQEAGADGGDAAAPKLCIATDCPEMRATCPGPVPMKCASFLSVDPKNCGVCGNVCPPLANGQNDCVNGACKLICDVGFGDCNADASDGCEVELTSSHDNCGMCGHACAVSEICAAGMCRPPPPQNDPCTSCPPPPGEAPTHMQYVCLDNKCNQLQCAQGWGNCNGTLDDGCETDLLHDPKNCAACGSICPAGQSCLLFINDPLPRCGCAPGLTLCPGLGCFDLGKDPRHCGACGADCGVITGNPAAPWNHYAPVTCRFGLCEATRCAEGWADCNGDPIDGCEVNLEVDPAHCGQCGNRCDIGAGQPCIDGACLMKECAPGQTQ